MNFLDHYDHPKNYIFNFFKKAINIAFERKLKIILEKGTSRGKKKFVFVKKKNWKNDRSEFIFEDFTYKVKNLERLGISAVVIEDKKGLKKNSLFGTDVKQEQESIDTFCAKLKVGINSQKTDEFLIIARI